MIGLYMDTEISGVNLSGKRSSILDHFIDKINSINQAGPGYIYIEESEGREYHDSPTSHMRSVILTKLVSAVPPKIGFWKTTNAEITVQLTDGSIVPLYDSYMMENGNNDTYQSHTYASPSYQIMAELDRYAEHGRAKETYTSSIDRHYATKYKRKVTFYAQNDYEDMKALNDLMEKENPHIFEDPNKTFADLYMKSGLYITEIVRRLYNNAEIQRQTFGTGKARFDPRSRS